LYDVTLVTLQNTCRPASVEAGLFYVGNFVIIKGEAWGGYRRVEIEIMLAGVDYNIQV